MPIYRVQLNGDPADIRTLREYLTNDQVAIEEDGNGHFLTSPDFQIYQDYRDVKVRAGQLVEMLNGIAEVFFQSFQPVSRGSVEVVRPDGTRATMLELEPVTAKTRASLHLPRTDLEPNDAEDALAASLTDQNVLEALHFYSLGRDPVTLYKVFEIIRHDVAGGDALDAMGLSAKDERKRFTHSVNHEKALGDLARHARLGQQPPDNPMSLEDARTFIRDLLKKWLTWKAAMSANSTDTAE